MKNIAYILLLVALCGSSCTTERTIFYSASAPDYNLRKNYQDPHFKKKINMVGVLGVAGATAAGGYLGYQSDLLVFTDQEGIQKSNKVGGAVVGAAVGFGVSSLANYLIFGLGQEPRFKNNQDLDRWIRKQNRNELLLSGNYQSRTVQIIDRRQENKYIVKNWQDILDFKTAFGSQSPAGNAVVEQGVSKLSREELPKLLDQFPNTSHAASLKKRYLELSNSVAQAIEAGNRYPELRTQSEQAAFNKINSVDDAATFMAAFPGSSYKTQVDDRAGNMIGSMADAKLFVQTFPKSKNITAVEKQAVSRAYNLADAREYQSTFQNKVYENDLVEKLGASLNRDDLPGLIRLFPTNTKINVVKQRYIRTSTSIFSLYYASMEYENTLSRKEVEDLARPLIKSLNEADDYLSYFKDGRHAAYASDFIQEAFLRDIKYLKQDNLPELSKFVYKYAALRNAPAEVSKLEEAINQAEKPFKDEFSKMVDKNNLDNYSQLLYVIYETQPDVRAFTVMDKALDIARSIDILNPWIDYIYTAGANGSVGIIYGHYCCPAVGSELVDIPRFKSKVGNLLLQNPYIIKHQIGYNGFATGDALKNWWNSGYRESSGSTGSGGSGSSAQGCSGGCRTNAKISVDVNNEIEDHSSFSLSGPDGVKIDIDYKKGYTNDEAKIRNYRTSCVAGTYSFTYTWNIGQSDQDSFSGTFEIDGTCMFYDINISLGFGKSFSVFGH
jgi:hypothetical protein